MVSRTWKWLAALTALLGVGLPLLGATESQAAGESPALCAPDDPNPEPGIQGDVPTGTTPDWDCGVEVVGFLPDASGAMAVAGTCAYTGGGGGEHGGVRVIDVSDPTQPTLVRVLDTGSRELLAAAESPDGERALLATRHRDTEAREGQVLGRDMFVDVWDIREDCTNPQLLGTVMLPTNSDVFGDPPAETGGPAHNLKFNPSLTKLYGSIPMHEIDLADLTDPSTWTVRNLHCHIADQGGYEPYEAAPGLCEAMKGTPPTQGPQLDHEPTFSPDGSRLFIGGQTPGPGMNNMRVLDMTGPDPVVLSITEQAPGHSIDFMTIDGREYLLHANEITATGCALPEQLRPTVLGFADRAYVLDITDETAPVKTSEIRLAASHFDQCAPNNLPGPSTAYHEVDDELDTTYAVIGFTSAGFRIFDMRNPADPVEVAYFNHGDSQHTKSYVIPETGHIWASDSNGFWVLELEPQVRSHLGLDDGQDPVEPNLPPSKQACENGGWMAYTDDQDRPFRNQGECVRYATQRGS